MKILDKYLLKSFLVTFATVFVILFFIFILQTVWLFISELAGKDLDFILILKFLLFSMPRIVPLVLPLSVLLASIMTFGSLAENYEFAAMKSAGISLQRTMKSLLFFIGILSIVAFVFANNVIPYAEYKFINFRRNIAQRTPAMAIAEGQFSEIGNYTIKVDKKSGEKGNFLSGIIIHIKSNNGEGNKTVITAKSGELISSELSNTLKLVLYDGYYYEDVKPSNYEERNRLPFAKATFKKDIINIDLSKLNTNIDNGEIANTNTMLNVSELKYTLDSLSTNYRKDIKSYAENSYQRIYSNSLFKYPVISNNTVSNTFLKSDLLDGFDKLRKNDIIKIAISTIESTSFTIDSSKFEMEEKQKNINSHWIAFYDKFVIAFACFLMFLIGAPLGSLIRKGGLGLPIVLAVAIFIIFHFINTFGKKVAQENGITPFMGTWMSSMVLSPLAILLTYRATNDIGGMINRDTFFSPIVKFFQNLPFIKKEENLETLLPEHTKAISKNESLLQLTNKIKLYNQIGLLFYFLSLILTFVILNFSQNKLLVLYIPLLFVLYTSIFITQNLINKLELKAEKAFNEGKLVALLLGFPLFFLNYFLVSITLKEVLSNSKLPSK